MKDSTNNLYRAADVRELDRLAIEEHHIPGYTLMERAASAAFQALLKKWPLVKNLLIFCGPGNNGGDGYVIAGLAQQHGLKVSVISLGDSSQIKGSAKQALAFANQHRVSISTFNATQPIIGDNQTVIVDAMLGTGISGDVRGDYRSAITLINQSDLPVLAVDIPSGLCSDTGEILGVAVKADITVSFIGLKIGQTINAGPACCGELHYDDLDVPKEIFTKVKPVN